MVGKTLSRYRILRRIGAGAMGEVFVAEDTELRRDVALKVLPAEFSGNPARLERFKREARAAAALNHPGIVTLLSVEEVDGVHFLTMELVDGETLDRAIPPDGFALERFFAVAVPLADALSAAHQRGVVHRDLKPGNVMLTAEGRPKILDFGLAKLEPVGERELETRQTTELLTQAGQILGTAAYMAPEQVEGAATDARSDIFSLGVILYEMATGRRPFGGGSAVAVMSAILSEEPIAPRMARPDIPKPIERVILHCLRKDPERRFQTALDVRNELAQLQDELVGPPPSSQQWRKLWDRRTPVWVAALLAAVALAVVLGRSGDEETRDVAQREEGAHLLRQVTVSEAVEGYPAYSADGAQLAYTKEVEGYMKIFARDLASGMERQLTEGTVDDIQPVWSPDGEAILFVRASRPDGKVPLSDPFFVHDQGDIWRLHLATGEAFVIAEEAFNPSFSPDGERIAFDAAWAGPRRIWTADSQGHNPRQVTSDSSELVWHLIPRWSPDGSRIVFQYNSYTTRFDIRIVDIGSGEMGIVTDDPYQDVNPVWSPDGADIYFSSYRSGGMNVWRVPVATDGSTSAAPEQVTTGAGFDVQLAFSPDGSELAFAVQQRNADLWRLPVDPDTGWPRAEPEVLVATTREDSRGAWSPDGSRVAFNSDRAGTMNLWMLSLRDGTTRQLTEGEGGDYQPNWSPDGETLAFFSSRSGNADVWTVEVESGVLRRLTEDPAIDISPAFSPDGEWVAFQSDRDGRREAWVMRADGTQPRQLTRRNFGGVHYFLWSEDSRHVIFRGQDGGAWRVLADGSGQPELVSEHVRGWHMSFSPDRSKMVDNDHHALLITDLEAGEPAAEVFAFDDPAVGMDYSVWSPDGEWILFDRTAARGGDIWVLELGR